jgi:hypothetical protein
VYDRVIIRWQKKLKRNDKEIKAKKIRGYREEREKCIIGDHREREKLLSAD